MRKQTLTIISVLCSSILVGCSDGPSKDDVARIYADQLDTMQVIEKINNRDIQIKLVSIKGNDCNKDGEVAYICTGTGNVEVTGSKSEKDNRAFSKDYKFRLKKNTNGNWVQAN